MSFKNRWKFKSSEIEPGISICGHILKSTDLKIQIEKFDKISKPPFSKCKLDFPVKDLQSSYLTAKEAHGLHKFVLKGKPGLGSYLSTSLTYDPDSVDQVSDDPHRSTISSKSFSSGNFSDYSIGESSKKPKPNERHTYNDTYAFTHLTPFAKQGAIHELLSTFERTLIRSRISVVMGSDESSTKLDFGWHNDEPIYINLRVNIPIFTSKDFALQIQSPGPGNKFELKELFMEEGNAYVYNTHLIHRPVTVNPTTFERVHMIAAISPWFDYISDEDLWTSNEYYGEVHPFEMFEKGYVTKLIS